MNKLPKCGWIFELFNCKYIIFSYNINVEVTFMRAIVLSGGGSKGAYEIGVWRALRKLHISYDIVTGTSVGALNAALMTQKDYLKGMLLWYNLKSDMVYDSSMDIKVNKDFLKYAKKIILDGGIDVQNLESTVKKYINVKKIYRSEVDLGIVTVKFPTLEPVQLTKKDIPMDKLTDYLIASASCFPAFQKKKIDQDEYMDGGFYDNLPINLAISMGATEVIAVDLEAVGIKRRVKSKNIPIKVISPKTDTGSFLVFDKVSSRRVISLGYNDTMKAYNKLDGDIFTFKKGTLKKNYDTYIKIYIDYFHSLLNIENKRLLSKILHLSIYEELFHECSDGEFFHKFNTIVERVGLIFGLDESIIYSMSKYHRQLFRELERFTEESFQDIYSNRNNARIKRLFHDDLMVAYLYYHLKQNTNVDDISNLIIIFPNAFLSALYLYIVSSR